MSNRASAWVLRVSMVLALSALAGSVSPAWALESAEPGKASQPAPAADVVDPAARQTLMDAAAAVKGITSISLKAKEETALGSIKTSGDVSVRLVRSASGAMSYRVEGSYEAPAFPRRQIVGAVLEGKTIQWLQQEDESSTKDGKQTPLYNAKTLYERPLGAPEPGVSRVTLPSNTFREVFMNADPFRQEIEGTNLTMEKPQTINGEECLVVRAVLNRGNIERIIYISAIDKLPRRYVRNNYAGGSRLGGQTLDFSELSMEKELKLQDIRLTPPAGFKTDTKTLADFPQLAPPPVNPRPPEVQPVPTKGQRSQPALTPEEEEAIKRKEEEMKNPSKKQDEPEKQDPQSEPEKKPKR